MFFKDTIRVSLIISHLIILKPLRNDKRFILISAVFPYLSICAVLDQLIIYSFVFVFKIINLNSEYMEPIVEHLGFIDKKQSNIDEEAEDQLYNQLKDLPDFLNYPLPSRWFKKYNIPPIEPTNVRDYIHNNHAFNMMFAPKDLPPIIIDKPQTDLSGNIKLVKMVEPEPIEVEVVSKPYNPEKTE